MTSQDIERDVCRTRLYLQKKKKKTNSAETCVLSPSPDEVELRKTRPPIPRFSPSYPRSTHHPSQTLPQRPTSHLSTESTHAAETSEDGSSVRDRVGPSLLRVSVGVCERDEGRGTELIRTEKKEKTRKGQRVREREGKARPTGETKDVREVENESQSDDGKEAVQSRGREC